MNNTSLNLHLKNTLDFYWTICVHLPSFVDQKNTLKSTVQQQIFCGIQYQHVLNIYVRFQKLPEEGSAAERHPHPAAQLCRLPQAAQLAVVEAVHQSQASPTGKELEMSDWRHWQICARDRNWKLYYNVKLIIQSEIVKDCYSTETWTYWYGC